MRFQRLALTSPLLARLPVTYRLTTSGRLFTVPPSLSPSTPPTLSSSQPFSQIERALMAPRPPSFLPSRDRRQTVQVYGYIPTYATQCTQQGMLCHGGGTPSSFSRLSLSVRPARRRSADTKGRSAPRSFPQQGSLELPGRPVSFSLSSLPFLTRSLTLNDKMANHHPTSTPQLFPLLCFWFWHRGKWSTGDVCQWGEGGGIGRCELFLLLLSSPAERRRTRT